jgi:uncharacterized repeat protein (TIGR03803 family)
MPSTVLNLPIAGRCLRVGVSLLAIGITALSPPCARAQYSENVLYDFYVSNSPGVITDSQGNLYGVVVAGGADNEGAIFEMSPPGNGNLWWTQKILYSFTSGAAPATALTLDSQGNLYGSTGGQGNEVNCGEVFKLSPPEGGNSAWSESVVHLFGGKEGVCGSSSLTLDSQGNLYGASQIGGTSSDGVIYELSPPNSGSGAWTETILYTFTGGSVGFYPMANVAIDSRGNLYGATMWGGSLSGCGGMGCGTVFEISPLSGAGTWSETTLYTFTGGSDGGEPFSLTLDSKGNLYGSTVAGGNTSACSANAGVVPGCGGIFELSPPSGGSGAWTLAVLHNFSGSDGRGAATGLTFDSAGALFGATPDGGIGEGGTGSCPLGCGLVFSLTPPSGGSGPWTETVLYDFSGEGVDENPSPFSAVVLDSDMNLYGTLDTGSIYELSPTRLVPSATAVVAPFIPPTLGESVTFTATVTPAGPPAPTGTVGFASNGVAIAGCSPVLLSAGQAVCSTTALAAGPNSIVAVYSGDGTYSESAGAHPELVTQPQLGLTVDPLSVSVNAGESVEESLNVTVVQEPPSGATTFACTGLPVGAACSFSPSQVTSFPASVMLTISTAASNARLRSRPLGLSFAVALALPGLLLLPMKRASSKRRFGWPLAVLLFLVLLPAGCGGSGGSGGGSKTGGSTIYTVVVTASAAGATSGSATITLTVVN